MSIHAIVWDVGGVLLRTVDFSPRAALAQKLNLTPAQLEHVVFGKDDAFRAQLGQISSSDHWTNIATRLNYSEAQVDAFRQEYFAQDVLDLDLIERIRNYKAQGYCIAVLSNFWDTLREHIQQNWQIDDAFHHLVISSEVGLMKPDPAIYELLLETIGFAPEETVFLDDALENVTAARALGMHAIRFNDKTSALAELEHTLIDTPP
jgi:epoxide hydrolase-like predicted phosphatase